MLQVRKKSPTNELTVSRETSPTQARRLRLSFETLTLQASEKYLCNWTRRAKDYARNVKALTAATHGIIASTYLGECWVTLKEPG